MINDHQFRTDDLIKSASELPDISPDLRKRVLKAARQAEQQRIVRRRVQWALGGSAAAILLATVFSTMTAPEHSTTLYAPGDMGHTAPGVLNADHLRTSADKAKEKEAEKHTERGRRFR